LCAAAFAVVVVTSSPTTAQAAALPCQALPESARRSYLAHVDAAHQAYRLGQWAEATARLRDAMTLCNEEPRNLFNLARTLDRQHDCEAVAWYDAVLGLPVNAGPADLPEL
jgi:hypothetical protein